MKNIFLSTIAVLGLAACGSSHPATVQSVDAPAATDSRVAFAMTATLGDVHAAAAQSPASGLWTEIELKYQVPCTESLATFNYALRSRQDGGTDLLASAIGTRSAQVGGLNCQSIRLETKKITVPGIVAREAVHLVNLNGSDEPLLSTTKSLEAIGLKVVGTHSLCPQGSACVLNGTVVRLETTKGVSCADKIGPVTYAFEQSDVGGKVKLAASAIDMVDSRAVRCAVFPKTVEITLPMIFVDSADINLTVVGGNN